MSSGGQSSPAEAKQKGRRKKVAEAIEAKLPEARASSTATADTATSNAANGEVVQQVR